MLSHESVHVQAILSLLPIVFVLQIFDFFCKYSIFFLRTKHFEIFLLTVYEHFILIIPFTIVLKPIMCNLLYIISWMVSLYIISWIISCALYIISWIVSLYIISRIVSLYIMLWMVSLYIISWMVSLYIISWMDSLYIISWIVSLSHYTNTTVCVCLSVKRRVHQHSAEQHCIQKNNNTHTNIIQAFF